MFLHFCAFFCIFFAFWPASVSRVAFFCILAGRRFQDCVFLHFGRSQDLGVPFFLHFAGPRASQPTKMQKQCNAKFRQGSKRKKKRKQQMQKNATRKKMQTANAKKNANSKCKTLG